MQNFIEKRKTWKLLKSQGVPGNPEQIQREVIREMKKKVRARKRFRTVIPYVIKNDHLREDFEDAFYKSLKVIKQPDIQKDL